MTTPRSVLTMAVTGSLVTACCSYVRVPFDVSDPVALPPGVEGGAGVAIAPVVYAGSGRTNGQRCVEPRAGAPHLVAGFSQAMSYPRSTTGSHELAALLLGHADVPLGDQTSPAALRRRLDERLQFDPRELRLLVMHAVHREAQGEPVHEVAIVVVRPGLR